jgi:hypothetical protein
LRIFGLSLLEFILLLQENPAMSRKLWICAGKQEREENWLSVGKKLAFAQGKRFHYDGDKQGLSLYFVRPGYTSLQRSRWPLRPSIVGAGFHLLEIYSAFPC